MKENIIIYSLPECGACKNVKSKLTDNGFEYQEISGRDEMVKIGLQHAPAMSVNGTLLSEYEDIEHWFSEKGIRLNHFTNEVFEDIWRDRYSKNDETYNENLHRVAKFVASAESEDKREHWEQKFYDLMQKGLFFPAGRTMSNAAIGERLTLNNCMVAGTKVITKRGLINIEDIHIGDKVITEDGSWQSVNEVMKREYEGDLYKLSSHYIYDDIICTPNHRFLTNEGWKRADELSKEKVNMLMTPNMTFDKTYEDIDLYDEMRSIIKTDVKKIDLRDDNKITVIKYGQKNRYNNNTSWSDFGSAKVNRYIKLTPDFRYFIGRWIGDGSVSKRYNNSSFSVVQIVFNSETEKDAAERCERIALEIFGIPCYKQKLKNQNVLVLQWQSEILGEWFYKEFGCGCSGKHLDEKYIGDFEILKGLFDADGSVFLGGAGGIVMKNFGIMNWVKDTMYLNGYNVYFNKVNTLEDTYRVVYNVAIGAKFNNNVTKTYTDDRLTKSLQRKNIGCVGVQVSEVLNNQKCFVYNLSVENVHSYTANGVVTHNCFTANLVGDSMEDIFDAVKLGALTHKAGGGIGYNFSALAPRGKRTNNDAIASGPVSFMDVFNAQTQTVQQGSRRK